MQLRFKVVQHKDGDSPGGTQVKLALVPDPAQAGLFVIQGAWLNLYELSQLGAEPFTLGAEYTVDILPVT